MKKVATIIAVMVCLNATAQDSSYNGQVKFNIGDLVDSGFTFSRRAIFEAMIYNQRTGSISLQFKVVFSNKSNNKDVSLVKPYVREIKVDYSNYVVSATGVFVGDIAAVLALYGKSDGNGGYLKLPDGRYDLTIPCMNEFDYTMKSFDNNNKLHNIIKAIGQREAAAGKLD